MFKASVKCWPIEGSRAFPVNPKSRPGNHQLSAPGNRLCLQGVWKEKGKNKAENWGRSRQNSYRCFRLGRIVDNERPQTTSSASWGSCSFLRKMHRKTSFHITSEIHNKNKTQKTSLKCLHTTETQRSRVKLSRVFLISLFQAGN